MKTKTRGSHSTGLWSIREVDRFGTAGSWYGRIDTKEAAEANCKANEMWLLPGSKFEIAYMK